MKVSKSFQYLMLLSLTFSSLSLGGETGTHGGQGVVCANVAGNITSVEVYDYYEAPKYAALGSLDLGDPNLLYQQQIKYVLDRLSKIDPVASGRFQARALTFESQVLWLTDAQMIDLTSDAHHVINPEKGCYTDQFAVQYFKFREGETKRYSVNRDLWSVASESTKAGLVLHEIIYQDAIEEFGQKNSDSTRYYNFAIASSSMAGISAEKYTAILYSSGFKSHDDREYNNLFSVIQNGFATLFKTSSHFLLNEATNEMEEVTEYEIDPVFQKISGQSLPIGRVGFGPDGSVKELNPASFFCRPKRDHEVQVLGLAGPNSIAYQFLTTPAGMTCSDIKKDNLSVQVDGITTTALTTAATIEVNPNRNFKGGALTSELNLQIQGQNITLRHDIRMAIGIRLFNDGTLRSGMIEGGVTLLDSKGEWIKLKNGAFGKKKFYNVTFDHDGKLLSYSQTDW